MAIKKTARKKVTKKKSTRRTVIPIEKVIALVASKAAISPACKSAVINYNAALRSLTAANKKVVAFTGRFEKSLGNVEKARTPRQKELAKKRLAVSRTARNTVIADARAKTRAVKDAERIIRALASLYTTAFEKFRKEFLRNAEAKAKALTPKARRSPTKRGIRLKRNVEDLSLG